MWRFTSIFAGFFTIYVFYSTYRINEDIWSAAGRVVVDKKNHKGGHARMNYDGEIEVVLDGKIIDVIDERKLNDNMAMKELKTTVRQAIAYSISAKAKGKKLHDFFYYS